MKKKFSLILIVLLSIIFLNTMEAKQYKVAILIYEGVYLLDFAGPLEIFNDAMENDTSSAFQVYLVSPDGKLIKAHTGTEITPQYSVMNSPQPDILVIPGGDLSLSANNKEVATWITKTSDSSMITMSVCTGAFILADLGILNGKEATTWFGAKKRLQKKYPDIKVVDKRFTDNGKIVTTAGVSAGIDGAIHVVERLFGKEIAEKTAKYIEWEK
jgi:transcriptional regulator GlxA family with amidase domain